MRVCQGSVGGRTRVRYSRKMSRGRQVVSREKPYNESLSTSGTPLPFDQVRYAHQSISLSQDQGSSNPDQTVSFGPSSHPTYLIFRYLTLLDLGIYPEECIAYGTRVTAQSASLLTAPLTRESVQ